MDPEARFERIEALLHAMAERQDRTEIRFNQRMDRAEARAQATERRWEKRMQAWEKRMEASEKLTAKIDHQLQVTSVLVKAGIKMVRDLARGQRELEKSQRAFLDSLRKGNGNGRH